MKEKNLKDKYPPSFPCSCDICMNYCKRPGWWTVEEAKRAIEHGYGNRMMLEVSMEQKYGVLAPAFSGNELNIALNIFSDKWCTFYKGGLCELHSSNIQPLECRYCHHSRKGKGEKCHRDLAKEWFSKEGQKLVVKWLEDHKILEKYGMTVKPI